MKATSDDLNPTPGYLYDEIASIFSKHPISFHEGYYGFHYDSHS